MATQQKLAGIRFPLDTYGWLEAEAKRTGTPVSALVREAVNLLKTDRRIRDQVRAAMAAKGMPMSKAAVIFR